MAWKYFEINNLAEAEEGEEICACYPNSRKNVSGKQDEENLQIAEQDAKEGKCKLLVWRKYILGDSHKVTENEKLELAKVLQKVGYLKGVVSEHMEDEIAIQGEHIDDYLLVTYMGQLLERGEMEIQIAPERMEYLKRLLHLDHEKEV